jgi:drug/metabolite transporter (DMT)-like permease
MPRRAIAIIALLGACLGWAFSFPMMKALLAHQADATAAPSAWLTNQALLVRYLGGAVLLGTVVCAITRRLPNRAEWMQALACALTSGLGLFLQMDALNHTHASTVGFLTQFYVVILPVVAAVQQRRRPSFLVMASVAMAFLGVAVLSGVSLHDLRPGRGELMTLGAAVLFTAHILVLGVPRWATNDGLHVTWAMFLLMGLLTLPIVASTGPGLSAIPACYPGWPGLAVLGFIVVVCSCLAYGLMTVWQRHVSGTEAGIIYCCEALFTAILCLFLPSLLGGWLVIPYANEPITTAMVLGGGLVIAGCVLVQWGQQERQA